MRVITGMVILAVMLQSPSAFSQGNDDVAELKQENELLRAKLEVANLKIENLERQLAELNSRQRDFTAEDEEDLFTVGSSWSGSRNYTHTGPSRNFQDWQLKILSREGNQFTGSIHFNSMSGTRQTILVSGNAPVSDKGAVSFKTINKGIFQQSFKGVLAGGQISLSFTGTGERGFPVKGTGTLKQ